MKLLLIFIYLITSNISYALEKPNIKNLVLSKNPKIYEEVVFKDSNDYDVNLDDFKGKLLILNFWATWCAPCREEMPSLDDLQSNSNFDNLKIFPINIGQENLSKSDAFFKEIGIQNLEIYFDAPITLAKKFSLRGVPTTILFNKKGEEFGRIMGTIDFNNLEFINWLKTFAYLGLDSKEPVTVGSSKVAPRDVLAAVLPNPAKLGHLMHGKTCAGTWVKGTLDGVSRELYLYHVADNETTMREWGAQAVLWQTAVCPVVALELLATGVWAGTGVKGPDAFDSVPFLNLLGEYGTHHGMVELGSGLWPSPRPASKPSWDRPVQRPSVRLR